MRMPLLLAGLLSTLCAAQDTRPAFDVATIHIVEPPGREFPRTELRRYPQRIDYSSITLFQLVRQAYDRPNLRIAWPERLAEARSQLYTVSATFPSATTPAQLREMLQRLLKDRSALRTHWAPQKVPGFIVTLAPGGTKLQPSKYDPTAGLDPQDDAQREARNRYQIFQGQEGWRYTGVITVPQLLGSLGADLGLPLADETGLTGYYDIDFSWNRPYVTPVLPGLTPPGEAPIPEVDKRATLFPALEKQLGLQVKSAPVTLEVLTIDSVQRVPTEN